jgi:hypothetical protein
MKQIKLYLFIFFSALCLEDYSPETKCIQVSASQISGTEERSTSSELSTRRQLDGMEKTKGKGSWVWLYC